MCVPAADFCREIHHGNLNNGSLPIRLLSCIYSSCYRPHFSYFVKEVNSFLNFHRIYINTGILYQPSNTLIDRLPQVLQRGSGNRVGPSAPIDQAVAGEIKGGSGGTHGDGLGDGGLGRRVEAARRADREEQRQGQREEPPSGSSGGHRCSSSPLSIRPDYLLLLASLCEEEE